MEGVLQQPSSNSRRCISEISFGKPFVGSRVVVVVVVDSFPYEASLPKLITFFFGMSEEQSQASYNDNKQPRLHKN